MPAIILGSQTFNATVFDGIKSPLTAKRAPQQVKPVRRETWVVLDFANGAQEPIYRESAANTIARVFDWECAWEMVPAGTRTAVELVEATTSWYTATIEGVAYAVQTKPGSYSVDIATVLPNGTSYYNLQLTVGQL